MTTAKYNANDVIYEASLLNRLLEATDEILGEMDYGVGETRNHALDRIQALARIALDLSGKVLECAESAFPGNVSARSRPIPAQSDRAA